MKKICALFSLIILFFILDNTVMPFLAIRGGYPSLLLVFCICYSMINGSWAGLWIGVVCGLLQDVYFLNVFGINGFATMIVCCIAGYIGQNLFKERTVIPIISSFFLSFLKGLIVLAILYLMNLGIHLDRILVQSIYNFVICIFMYGRVYALCQKDFMKKKWKFNER